MSANGHVNLGFLSKVPSRAQSHRVGLGYVADGRATSFSRLYPIHLQMLVTAISNLPYYNLKGLCGLWQKDEETEPQKFLNNDLKFTS